MDPHIATKLLAQAYVRDAQLTAALHTIAGLDPSRYSAGPLLADQVLRGAPAAVSVPTDVVDVAASPAVGDPQERLIAAMTRLLVAAESVIDRSKSAEELIAARGLLGLAVVVAEAELRDILPAERMDGVSLAITLQRQNEALRATLESAHAVARRLTPGGSALRTLRARLLVQIESVLALKTPVGEPAQDWAGGSVATFPRAVKKEGA